MAQIGLILHVFIFSRVPGELEGGCQWVGATGSDEVGMSLDTGGQYRI